MEHDLEHEDRADNEPRLFGCPRLRTRREVIPAACPGSAAPMPLTVKLQLESLGHVGRFGNDKALASSEHPSRLAMRRSRDE